MRENKRQTSFDTSYAIYYFQSTDGKPFLRRKPGVTPYIAFEDKHKGDIDYLLDALIILTEADRALSIAERNKDIVIFLDDKNRPYKHLQGSVSPNCLPVYVQPYLADHASFCSN